MHEAELGIGPRKDLLDGLWQVFESPPLRFAHVGGTVRKRSFGRRSMLEEKT